MPRAGSGAFGADEAFKQHNVGGCCGLVSLRMSKKRRPSIRLNVETMCLDTLLSGRLKTGNLWTAQNRQFPRPPRPVSSTDRDAENAANPLYLFWTCTWAFWWISRNERFKVL